MVLHMSTSTVHLHRLKNPDHISHSRFTCLDLVHSQHLWIVLSVCPCGEALAIEWVSRNTSPGLFFLLRTCLSPVVRKREFVISLGLTLLYVPAIFPHFTHWLHGFLSHNTKSDVSGADCCSQTIFTYIHDKRRSSRFLDGMEKPTLVFRQACSAVC